MKLKTLLITLTLTLAFFNCKKIDNKEKPLDSNAKQQSIIESEISIAVNPNNSNEVIVAFMKSNSPITLYTSTNAGSNWKKSSFNAGIADPVVTYGDNNTAYLTYLGVDKTLKMYLAESTDNGINWKTKALTLDGMAADKQWIKRDNSATSPYYGNIYLSYFHPEENQDIHIVKIDKEGNIGKNHAIHKTSYKHVQNPAMDINSLGNIVVCFFAVDNDGNRMIVSTNSTDGGENFSPEKTVTDIHMYNKSGSPVTDVIGFAPGESSRIGNSLQMAIDKSSGIHAGRVYLSWTDFVKGNPNEGMNIYLSYSDDNGTNWSTPKIVNDDNISSSHQYYAGIDVNSSGVLLLSWYDRRNDPKNDALTDFYFTYSTNGGDTFKPSVKINSVSSDHTAVTKDDITFGVGEYTSIASSEKDAYIVWSDGRENNGNMNIYFSRYTFNNTNTSKNEVRINKQE